MDPQTLPWTDLARWAGAHALPLFFAALASVLAGTGSLWWALHRWGVHRPESPWPPMAHAALRMGIGFSVIVGAAGVFTELADELGADVRMGQADQAFSDALWASVPASARQVFGWLTHLGDPQMLVAVCIAVAVALLMKRRRWLALAWLLTLAGNAALNATLKHVFERARPIHPQGFIEQGFSFPSGHTSGSLVTFGMLAYVLTRFVAPAWHLRITLAAAAAAFTVGCSRVFINVHFASDVLAGFASGAAWLAVCISSVEAARLYRRR